MTIRYSNNTIFVKQKDRDMKTTQRQPITNERLLEIVKEEIAKCGEYVFSDKRRTAQEMLRTRGVRF